MTRDPYRLDGPTLLNISGGRTSALMLRRVLDGAEALAASRGAVAGTGRVATKLRAVMAETWREMER